jgi:SAM-dependent methyltransferase
MYDEFSADYDRFVDWQARLAVEMPFIEGHLQAEDAHRVLDAACGTGMHAITLARSGYEVTGTDLSAGMIARARENALTERVSVRFEPAGFGQLAARVGSGYDGVLCLGNSLPHLLNPNDLTAALADFAACLRPGGMLMIQNRNFDIVLAQRERWMEPQFHQEGDTEWLFFRFYDFEPDSTLMLNVVTLKREGTDKWMQNATSTRLWPLRQEELLVALEVAGFGEFACWGDLQGSQFDPVDSGNLIVQAIRV